MRTRNILFFHPVIFSSANHQVESDPSLSGFVPLSGPRALAFGRMRKCQELWIEKDYGQTCCY